MHAKPWQRRWEACSLPCIQGHLTSERYTTVQIYGWHVAISGPYDHVAMRTFPRQAPQTKTTSHQPLIATPIAVYRGKLLHLAL